MNTQKKVQNVQTHSAAETEALGKRIAQKLQGGEVLALFGPMGMGKTAFTRGVAAGLGTGGVSSPTFALVHVYDGGRLPLYHFDMYRVEGWDDLSSTGYFDYLEDGGVMIVEWSENIEEALPPEAVHITFARGKEDDDRLITIESSGSDIL
ncbi:MAG TPA: tRNA (adenosine(37)-N6)-threonylcarbamoyltransferase complex ATPase subunit type 1 TsaE [Ruminococcaceae bacterium]|nr:tRNA (adenosine(37)-N6)-threonylcarbamoyltransferase complex ATPase subunit type 1 TsaE [Oscillospiraceae bacterium]HCM22930.1 tRNA (adenosine(37)-N6)-threonylcarbamoyltransferase complex ATPase subunit type 1 TsaE [Oscillospiraceae bacterium]